MTVGILAYCGSAKIGATGMAERHGIQDRHTHCHQSGAHHGVGCKAGLEQTGPSNLKFSARTAAAINPSIFIFSNLPFADGNMTISRSPLKDSDFSNLCQIPIPVYRSELESDSSNVVLPC